MRVIVVAPNAARIGSLGEQCFGPEAVDMPVGKAEVEPVVVALPHGLPDKFFNVKVRTIPIC